MEKLKRDRGANFSLKERDILVSLVQKYQAVLENKKSDAFTWKKKEATWECIQNEFNSRSGGVFRPTKTLKIKYEGLKRTVRKKSAACRSELCRTGGGKNSAPPLDSVEEQIKAMISLSTDGLESTLPQTEETESLYLQQTQDSQGDFLVTNESKSMLPSTSTETIPEENYINFDNVNDKVLPDMPRGKCEKTKVAGSANNWWDVTSRRNLKFKKHRARIAIARKRSHFHELTQANLELVQLQKKLLEEEIIEKKKVWKFDEIERKKEAEFKEKERKWKEQEYKLKLGDLFQ